MRTTKINQRGWLGALVLASSLPVIGQAAVYPINSTLTLHYNTDAAFDSEWRLSSDAGIAGSNNPRIISAGGTDGDVLRGGFYGEGNPDFRIYDTVNAANATDITVFNVSGAGPNQAFHAYKDFRLASLPTFVAENYYANLAAVSTDGTTSLMGGFYSNGGPGAANGYFRFDSFNFNTGAFQTHYGLSALTAISTSQWYRLKFDMVRESADPTKVDLTVSLYGLVGGLKGGATNSLVGSFSVTGLAAIGDFVQFGMKGDANDYYNVYSDNFLAFVDVPEPTTAVLLAVGGACVLARRRLAPKA